MFRVMLTASGFSVLSNFIAVYLPTKAVDEGLTGPQTATLYTVQGALDLVSRLSMGFVADLGIIPKPLVSCLDHAMHTGQRLLKSFKFDMCDMYLRYIFRNLKQVCCFVEVFAVLGILHFPSSPKHY